MIISCCVINIFLMRCEKHLLDSVNFTKCFAKIWKFYNEKFFIHAVFPRHETRADPIANIARFTIGISVALLQLFVGPCLKTVIAALRVYQRKGISALCNQYILIFVIIATWIIIFCVFRNLYCIIYSTRLICTTTWAGQYVLLCPLKHSNRTNSKWGIIMGKYLK